MNTKVVLSCAILLLVATLACTLSGAAPTATPDLVGTITAQAALLAAPTLTGTGTSVPPTDTSSPLTVSVTANTNCRLGPTTDYEVDFTLHPGETALVVGKNTDVDYWIIDDPGGATCWLWGQYAVLSGDASGVPEIPAPQSGSSPKASKTPKATKTPGPTPTTGSAAPSASPTNTAITLHPPQAPSGLSASKACQGGYAADGFTPIWKETVGLLWTDNADNELGFRIYRNGSAITNIGPNSGAYYDQIQYNQGTGGPLFDNYGVEAFNGDGASSRPSVDVGRCP
jgi:hypothetical protein